MVEKIIDLNAKSVLRMTHLWINRFSESSQVKCIVYVGSVGGIIAGSLVYSTSKHFVTSMAMILRAELKPLAIQVNLVCPGPVETEFDKNAGIEAGMISGPSQKMCISAQSCAKTSSKE